MLDLTQEAQYILTVSAQEIVYKLHSSKLLPEHVLLAILRLDKSNAYKIIHHLMMDVMSMKQYITVYLRDNFLLSEKSIGRAYTDEVPLSDETELILRYASQFAQECGHAFVGSEHILYAYLRYNDNGYYILESNNIVQERLEEAFNYIVGMHEDDNGYIAHDIETIEINQSFDASDADDDILLHGDDLDFFLKDTKNQKSMLMTYAINMIEQVQEHIFDPVIGRDKELQRCIQILLRRFKNNALLIGEPGVGKTAVVEGLAQAIVQKTVPKSLHNKIIWQLDLPAMLAGTKYRGEFEQRLKILLKELEHDTDSIIFIDEIHTIIDTGAAEGAIDASNIIKPVLARGGIQCIGATTINEYRLSIEKDGALDRRFQQVFVAESTKKETFIILQKIKSYYEQYHNVVYSDAVLQKIIDCTAQYIPYRFFPDKAIDYLDEIGAMKNTYMLPLSQHIIDIDAEIAGYKEQKIIAVQNQNYEDAAQYRDIIERLEDERITLIKSEHTYEVQNRHIGITDIYHVLYQNLQIPWLQMEDSQRMNMDKLAHTLKSRVIGHGAIIDAICTSIRRTYVQLSEIQKPIANFFFAGPSGVGKTELAKQLGYILFGHEHGVLRIDMSDYSEKYAITRLFGTAPGYIGYEQEGLLSKHLRRQPYAVIIFDEIEKAHRDIYNYFLPILEEGEIYDGQGRLISFRNSIIIFTSNIGMDSAQQSLGFANALHKESEYMHKSVRHSIKHYFSREFLNRLDEIFIFNYLEPDSLEYIAHLYVTQLIERIQEQYAIVIKVDTPVIRNICALCHTKEQGARVLHRTLEKKLQTPLIDMLITTTHNTTLWIIWRHNTCVIMPDEEWKLLEMQLESDANEASIMV